MNIKKTFLVSVSAILMAASAFAYSKKQEGEANLGRMYVELGGGASFTDMKDPTHDSNQVGAVANALFNVPIFKPGVNTLEDIDWLGLDMFVNLGYGYLDIDYYDEDEGDPDANIRNNQFDVTAGLKPYLCFKTGWSFIQAIKPFAYGSCGYQWNTGSLRINGEKFSGDFLNTFVYNYGGGVEIVFNEGFSLSGKYLWHSASDRDFSTYRTVDAELTYWANSIVAFSVFGEWNFGNDSIKHAKTFGLKVRFGFGR